MAGGEVDVLAGQGDLALVHAGGGRRGDLELLSLHVHRGAGEPDVAGTVRLEGDRGRGFLGLYAAVLGVVIPGAGPRLLRGNEGDGGHGFGQVLQGQASVAGQVREMHVDLFGKGLALGGFGDQDLGGLVGRGGQRGLHRRDVDRQGLAAGADRLERGGRAQDVEGIRSGGLGLGEIGFEISLGEIGGRNDAGCDGRLVVQGDGNLRIVGRPAGRIGGDAIFHRRFGKGGLCLERTCGEMYPGSLLLDRKRGFQLLRRAGGKATGQDGQHCPFACIIHLGGFLSGLVLVSFVVTSSRFDLGGEDAGFNAQRQKFGQRGLIGLFFFSHY